jgi:hypothetical protein
MSSGVNGGEVALDTILTAELENEGLVREANRALQGARRDKKLQPQQTAQSSVLTISVMDTIKMEDIATLKIQGRVENIRIEQDASVPKGSVLGKIE